MTEDKEKKPKEPYELKEIVTGTETAIGETGSDKAFSVSEALVRVLNKLDKIEKAVA